jgi:hypothetical protein
MDFGVDNSETGYQQMKGFQNQKIVVISSKKL